VASQVAWRSFTDPKVIREPVASLDPLVGGVVVPHQVQLGGVAGAVAGAVVGGSTAAVRPWSGLLGTYPRVDTSGTPSVF